MTSIIIDGAAFRASLFELEGDIYRATADALTHGVDVAAKDAFSTNAYRNHTWKLREGTKATVDKFAFKGRIENRVRYASFVESGTKPHVIEARKKPLLRFYWTRHGMWFAGKRVKHPGTKPTLFFLHAGETGGAAIEREITHRLDQLTARFNRDQ